MAMVRTGSDWVAYCFQTMGPDAGVFITMSLSTEGRLDGHEESMSADPIKAIAHTS